MWLQIYFWCDQIAKLYLYRLFLFHSALYWVVPPFQNHDFVMFSVNTRLVPAKSAVFPQESTTSFEQWFSWQYMGVSKNNGTPKSSILIGFSMINHAFGVTLFSETPTWIVQHFGQILLMPAFGSHHSNIKWNGCWENEKLRSWNNLLFIPWVVPPPSNSHHQDYYIFSRGSL